MLAAPARNPSVTLQKLRVAARDLFVSRGYHDTRPQDIARQAGVANGTFYLHFPDKQAVFLDFADQALNELVEAFRDTDTRQVPQADRWQAIFGVLIDFGTRQPGLLQAAFLDPVLIAPHDEHAWRIYDRLGRFMSVMLEQAERDSPAAVYDKELISHAICGAVRHAMTYAFRKGVERQKMISDLGLFIDRGLGVKR
ncbi:MAG: TetR/AcrR family transcriptional regulator [Pseudomonadales bacterium]|nr:TetR/AcrR family transcriptional regulator [Pseudomonadales bacterium]